MFIVNVSCAGLKPCRCAANVRVPLSDYSRRVPIQDGIYIWKLKCPPVFIFKTLQSTLVVFVIVSDVGTPAYPSLLANHCDGVSCGIFTLNDYLSHISFLSSVQLWMFAVAQVCIAIVAVIQFEIYTAALPVV